MKPIIVTSAEDIKSLEYDIYFCARSGRENTKRCVNELREEGYIISAIWKMDYRDLDKYLIHFHAGDEVKERAREATKQQLSDQPSIPVLPKGLRKREEKKISYRSQ